MKSKSHDGLAAKGLLHILAFKQYIKLHLRILMLAQFKRDKHLNLRNVTHRKLCTEKLHSS